MDTALIRLLTRAARAGVETKLGPNGRLLVRNAGDFDHELRSRHDDIVTLLAGPCAACGAEPWIDEADTHIPWCRPCANLRGLQLLRVDNPELFEENTCVA